MVGKNTWYVINIKFVKLALWPSKWPCLENVLCVLKKNVYFVVIGCSVLYRPILSIMPYICYFLHNSACVIYSLLKMGYWSLLLLLFLSVFPFSSAYICYIYLGASKLDVYIFTTVISSWWTLYYIMTFFVSYDKVYSFWLKNLFCVIQTWLVLLSFVYHLPEISFLIPSLSACVLVW